MINIIGQFFGTSGYASHTRHLANSLNKLVDCKVITLLNPGFEREVNDQELEMIKREMDYDTNLIITHPMYWRGNLSAKYNIVYLIWEGDIIPRWMAQECFNPRIDKIIVPSKHTKMAVEKSIEEFEGICQNEVLDKLVVIPHGVNLDIFHPLEVKKDKFRFLSNKGLRNLEDRGGVQYAIKAFMEEFKVGEAELHVKINTAYGIPDFKQLFPGLEERTDIVFHIGDMTPIELNNLYNMCDVYVSPTRAEAFNIPCLESLACGKPVITTNYGGQTDYIDNEVGWLVDYKLTQVEHDLEYEEVKWATPNMECLKKVMRNVFEEYKLNSPNIDERKEICIERAKQYTWDNTAKHIHSLIN